MGVDLHCSVITRNLKGKLDKNKNLRLANPPPRESRSDACFLSLELAWLEFNKFLRSLRNVAAPHSSEAASVNIAFWGIRRAAS